MGNPAGVFAVLAAFARPGLVVPHAVVPDISFIDWKQLRQAGVEHVVIDKDNCITLPHRDSIAPGLESAWQALVQAGFRSILIVSNSAGSSDDPLAISAEHVARCVGQPVLAHPAKKPANACARQIVDVLYEPKRFDANGPPLTPVHVAVVGDRITTDIVLAARIEKVLRKRIAGSHAIGILTTSVLERERLATRTMRRAEMWALARLDRLGIQPGQGWRRTQSSEQGQGSLVDWQAIVLDQEAARKSAELEAASQNPADIGQLFVETLRRLGWATARGVGLGLQMTAMFLGKTAWSLLSNGLYLATRGRVGAPSQILPSISSLREPPSSTVPSAPMHTKSTPSLITSSYNSLVHYRISRKNPLVGQRRELKTSSILLKEPRRQPNSSTRPDAGAISQQARSRQRFRDLPGRQKAVYFFALLLLPAGWYGGAALHERLHASQELEELRRAASQSGSKVTTMATAPAAAASEGRLKGPQSAQTPSLIPSRNNDSGAPSREIQSLQTARLHILRDLSNIDEKLTRVRNRQQDNAAASSAAAENARKV